MNSSEKILLKKELKNIACYKKGPVEYVHKDKWILREKMKQ